MEIDGDTRPRSATIRNNSTGACETIPASAVFVFIGQKPQTEFLDGLVLRTESGHILTGLDLPRDPRWRPAWPLERDPLILETSVPGIFAAGDARNGTRHGVGAAAGDGNVAVSMFWQYLSTI